MAWISVPRVHADLQSEAQILQAQSLLPETRLMWLGKTSLREALTRTGHADDMCRKSSKHVQTHPNINLSHLCLYLEATEASADPSAKVHG